MTQREIWKALKAIAPPAHSDRLVGCIKLKWYKLDLSARLGSYTNDSKSINGDTQAKLIYFARDIGLPLHEDHGNYIVIRIPA